MTDIAKCSGENCEKKQECFRFLAESNPHRQAFIVIDDATNCDQFWPIRSREELEITQGEWED